MFFFSSTLLLTKRPLAHCHIVSGMLNHSASPPERGLFGLSICGPLGQRGLRHGPSGKSNPIRESAEANKHLPASAALSVHRLGLAHLICKPTTSNTASYQVILQQHRCLCNGNDKLVPRNREHVAGRENSPGKTLSVRRGNALPR